MYIKKSKNNERWSIIFYEQTEGRTDFSGKASVI